MSNPLDGQQYNPHHPAGMTPPPSTDPNVPQSMDSAIIADMPPEDLIQFQADIADAMQTAQAALVEERNRILDGVAKDVEGKLTQRMGTRKAKENQWLESLRLYLGSLSTYNIVTGEYPFGTASDKTLAHKPEVNITRKKCETAIAQTMAFQFAAGDKNWDLQVPAFYQLDPDDQQMLASMTPPPQQPQPGQPPAPQQQPISPDEYMQWKCDQMEKQMETHLNATGYGVETRKAGWDRVVLGVGIMKGPTNSTKVKKSYVKMPNSQGTVTYVPKLVQENVPCIYRVNPWYFFPDDTVTDIEDAENSIEIHPMSKTQLRDMLKNPAFLPDVVQKCLEEEPRQYTNSPFNDPAYLTQGVNLLKNRYLVLEYHGPMCKDDLEAIGKTPVVESPDDEYFVEVWVVNSRVIRIEFSNLEGCYRVPYAMSPWEPDPATVFGFGIPMLVRDQQRVVNETFKMMLDNAGISAGPQVIVDTTIIKPAEGGLECTPWKVWYANEYGADTSKAIQFFMPQNAFDGLSALFTMSMSLADQESSIPELAGNLGAPTGASDSATGMAIAQQSASSPLFYKSEQWDDQITKPLIGMLYDWEMQYNPDNSIKDNYDVDVKTSTAYLQSALNQQKLERLSMEIAQGSPIGEWIELDEMAQARLMDMRLPYKNIVKSPQKVMQERASRPPAPPDPNMLKAQAEMQKVQIDGQRLQMEQQQFQVDTNQKYQEAVMQYQAQLKTDEVRAQEAQASVLKAQFDFQAAMANLASQDEQHRQTIMADLQKSAAQIQTQKFLAGGEMAMRAKDQQLKEKELTFKKTTGKSGI